MGARLQGAGARADGRSCAVPHPLVQPQHDGHTIFYAGAINVHVVQTMFIQQGLGGSALLAGLASLPPALATGVGSSLGARWLEGHRWRVVVWGLILILVGVVATMLVMFPIADGASIWWNAVTMSLLGFGTGMATSTLQNLALEDVPTSSGGTAGGILQTGQRFGSAIGMAIIPGVWFATVPSDGHAWAHAYAYFVIGGFVLVAVVFAFFGLRRSRG